MLWWNYCMRIADRHQAPQYSNLAKVRHLEKYFVICAITTIINDKSIYN